MVNKSKAWYLHCDECQWEQVEFHKDDVDHFMKTHNCEKYLKRRALGGNTALAKRFDIVVTKRET